jgi:mono/diheme cytochrome c family protein
MKKMKRTLIILSSGIILSSIISSCSKSRGNNPGIEYAPDMYYSKGYEPFQEQDSNKFNRFGSNMREPVKGSVAIGQMDYNYPYPNNAEGYEAAGMNLSFPSDFKFDIKEASRLYGIYCSPCHGKDGKNDGNVAKRAVEVKPSWSGYQDSYIQTLPVGKIYHVITFGRNNMGSHASVLTPNQRWQVIAYVKQLSLGSGNVESETVQADTAITETDITIENNN